MDLNKSTKNESLYKANQFGLSKYANKKGLDKYQLCLDSQVLDNIIRGDQATLDFIRNVRNQVDGQSSSQ
jgi:hypothetical protein